ncbi:transposase [bacterium]|nr:transposase [bacterium]
MEKDLRHQIEFLKAENEMLRRRVPKQKIFLRQEERERLLKLGLVLGPAIRQMITIVDYSTFRRWVRKADGEDMAKKTGRPRIAVIIREFVVRVAKETGWGYSRILGEIRKLGLGNVSRQTVKNILVENGLDPGPKRSRGTWSEFLKAHQETLWQCDFFSKRIWTPTGRRQVFALAFINVATRKVIVTPSAFSTGGKWIEQQARAFLEHVETEGLVCTILMRDMDKAFSERFHSVFNGRGIEVKPVGPRAPNLNAFIERWIQSLKQEALDHFIVFGQSHFDFIVREYVAHYHEERPHQGIGNVLLLQRGEPECEGTDDEVPALSMADIQCQERLGGILKSYSRAA